MLQAVGLTESEEAVYRALLRNPQAPLADLAANAGTSAARTSQVLARLAELGLARRATRGRFLPIHPEASLGALVHRRRAELDAVQGATEELAEEFRAGELEADPAGLIEVLVGLEAISRRALEIFQGTTTEAMAFDAPPYAQAVDTELAVEEPILARGVKVRVIYSQAALELPGRFEHIRQLAALGEQARILPSLPMKLRIADSRIAMVPLTTTGRATESVAIVHRSGLLDALIALFEALWAVAHPLERSGESQGLSDEDARVLGMLGAGLKDETIAQNLGVSMRTAGRRIRHVLDLLQASTRFQAGAAAARHGWLPTAAEPQQAAGDGRAPEQVP